MAEGTSEGEAWRLFSEKENVEAGGMAIEVFSEEEERLGPPPHGHDNPEEMEDVSSLSLLHP